MPFTVTVARPVAIHQGLRSPVRAGAQLGPLEVPSGSGRQVELRIGISFDDDDLTHRGWFFDTDALAQRVDRECSWLESAPWTRLFTFRPTMELVSRDLFRRLRRDVEKLDFVELHDHDLGVVTCYRPSADVSSGVGAEAR